MIDLHVHSTESDGSDTPKILVNKALTVGLSFMALTDHDTTDGMVAFFEACRATGLNGISGVELSADVDEGTLHIIGLGMDIDHPPFVSALKRMVKGREDRNDRLLMRLNQLGLTLTWDEVKVYAGADLVSRVHFARALVMRRYVGSILEAFKRYLAKGAPAYVQRERFSIQHCLRLICDAGGLPIIAHPHTWEVDIAQQLPLLKTWGLAGIEAYYMTYSAGQVCDYLRLAYRFDLLTSCASDYHGVGKPSIHLGKLKVPRSVEMKLIHALGKCPGKVFHGTTTS